MTKILALLMVGSLALTGCTKGCKSANNDGGPTFTMGFTPAENAETVTTNGQVIADLIHKQTGIKIKTYVASDYTALIESMKKGQVNFG